MTFDDILAQVLELLQREKRVSYRALKLRFNINDDYIEGLKDELVYAKKLAIDEENRVLVWTGDQDTSPPPPVPSTSEPPAHSALDQAREPLSYTPKHLAEKILTSRSALEGERKQVTLEIMVPLVSISEELRQQAELIDEVAREVMGEHGIKIEYLIGTMIELPRAALTADKIAQHASFFSFGTNDLTQTTFGLSRDDSGRFLPSYVDRKILADDPFQVLDREGVGELVRIGADRGRSVKPDRKIGICGEHGGDPQSIAFCNEIGLNYVSCSPYRVPVARLAAAQAALEAEAKAAAERSIDEQAREAVSA